MRRRPSELSLIDYFLFHFYEVSGGFMEGPTCPLSVLLYYINVRLHVLPEYGVMCHGR